MWGQLEGFSVICRGGGGGGGGEFHLITGVSLPRVDHN